MANIVTVSGMFGERDGQIHTYFVDSPVVIDISGLQWPGGSPFNIVRVEVIYDDNIVGDFRVETNRQSSVSLDISSALRSIWSGYPFLTEKTAAQEALNANAEQSVTRYMRTYFLRVFTEYLSSDDGGVFTITQCVDSEGRSDIPGGQCLLGGLTERERSEIEQKEDADVSYWEHKGVRNGDASTKPTSSPERVGRNSITSWVDVQTGLTKSIFYPASVSPKNDDIADRPQGWEGHAPIVLRDSVPYTDFLFVNRRGAVETCSALMKEAMEINVATTQYSRVERPAFTPTRTLMTISKEGRRSWAMSSGHVTREWAEWWMLEFLMARRHWMLYKGKFLPVTVTPAKNPTTIYDRAKPQMTSVGFTVTLAFGG